MSKHALLARSLAVIRASIHIRPACEQLSRGTCLGMFTHTSSENWKNLQSFFALTARQQKTHQHSLCADIFVGASPQPIYLPNLNVIINKVKPNSRTSLVWPMGGTGGPARPTISPISDPGVSVWKPRRCCARPISQQLKRHKLCNIWNLFDHRTANGKI